MTAARRYLNLNAYLRNSGYHEAAGRVSPADPASVLGPRHYIELAQIRRHHPCATMSASPGHRHAAEPA